MNKKIRMQVISAAVIVFLFNTLLKAQSPHHAVCVEVNGKVAGLKSKSGTTYKVELLCNDKILDAKIIQNNKTFNFCVPKNEYCAIRISKPGYATRLISVYSHVFQNDSGFYRFDFETELIEEAKAARLDKELLDFPIAIISYDKQVNGFYYNEEYTSNIKRELFLKPHPDKGVSEL